MESAEFDYHLELISQLLGRTKSKIVLFHNPYTTEQELKIDHVMLLSNGQIVGKCIRGKDEQSLKALNELLEKLVEQKILLKSKDIQIDCIVLGEQSLQ